MVVRKKVNETNQPVAPLDKIARLLGVLVAKGIADKPEQISMLRSVGFEVSEVASILNVTENNIHVAMFRTKNKKKSRKK